MVTTANGSGPTLQDYLNIASWVYNSGQKPGAPSPGYQQFTFTGDHYESPHQYDAYDPGNGFYAAAYVKGRGANRNVVIGFEGTNLYGSTQLAAAMVADDVQLYYGQLPTALREAVDFTNSVIATAERRGIGTDHIFLDGHSLGAAEAEYTASQTGLTGVTFGTVGVSTDFAPAGSGSGLQNYVDYGDPVGNYAYQPAPPVEGNFVYSDKIEHVGNTQYVGNPFNALPLVAAGQLYGNGSTVEDASALAILLAAAEAFHPLSNYAADLGLNTPNFPPGAQSLNPSQLPQFLHNAAGGDNGFAHALNGYV